MKRIHATSSRPTGRRINTRFAAACALVALPLAAWFDPLRAQTSPPPPTAQSFLVLDPDENGDARTPARFTQELFAATQLDAFSGETAKVLGGVAFAPNGDVWSAECLSNFSTLHRFSRSQYRDLTPSADNHLTITPRVELPAVPTEAGCGIVNHPDGVIYSNNAATYQEEVSASPIAAASPAAASSPSAPTVLYPGGVTRVHADTGLPIAWPYGQTHPAGPAGNALGIAVDPVTLHLVYAGEDCDDKGESLPTCTLWSLDPGTATTPPSATMWAQSQHVEMPFVDGIYFSKDGQYLFVTNRTDRLYDVPGANQIAVNMITVLRRPASTGELAQVVQHIPLATEPDGISFHTSGQFLVTNDEEGATMSRFDFPNGFDNPPSHARTVTVFSGNGDETIALTLYGTPFATQGHRGDLSQVGPDGCIYATQGRDFSIDDAGTRYDNGDVTTEDSIVKICATPGNGGFEPPPGVTGDPTPSGSIEGSAYLDVDGNRIISAGDRLLSDVPVALSGVATGATTTSGASAPTYGFDSLAAGDYTVSAPTTAFGYMLVSATADSVAVTLASGEHRTGVDFLYVPGMLSGSVYLDMDDDGAIDVDGDSLLPNVPLTLDNGTPNVGSTMSGGGPSTPTYTFPALVAGTYTVTGPTTASGYQLSVAPVAQILAPGTHVEHVDFLYKAGRLSGYAYVDSDSDGVMDVSEPRLANVTITGPWSQTNQTATDGSYSFTGLAAGSYSLTASAMAQGYALTTASPLTHDLAAGEDRANLNFGYRPGSVSGYAYVDVNRNSAMDFGETRLPGVSISGPNGTSRLTDSSGRYEFLDITSGSYTLTAPVVASGYGLFTTGALPATVTAPGALTDKNFGYVPGAISGFAYVDANGNSQMDSSETILPGVTITLDGTTTAVTDGSGAYGFGNLAAGTHTVSAPSTVGAYTRSTGAVLTAALQAGGTVPNLNFGYVLTPPPPIAFVTYTQGGWGAPPNGHNPGMLLQNNFATVYGSTGVTIGLPGVSGKYYLRFTSSTAIRNFLPTGGAPKALKASATNPTTSAAGVFAGQVLAVKLSVGFSAAGITAPGLGSLKVAAGHPLAGQTVNQVLALAEQALGGGGLASGVSFSALNDVMTRINENFDNGTTNNGFLVP